MSELNRRIAEALGYAVFDSLQLDGKTVLLYKPLLNEGNEFRMLPDWEHDLNAIWPVIVESGMQIEQPLTWDDWSTPEKYAAWLCEAWLEWKGQAHE